MTSTVRPHALVCVLFGALAFFARVEGRAQAPAPAQQSAPSPDDDHGFRRGFEQSCRQMCSSVLPGGDCAALCACRYRNFRGARSALQAASDTMDALRASGGTLTPEMQRMIERADMACGDGAMLYAGFRRHCVEGCTTTTNDQSSCEAPCECVTARLRAYPTPATARAFYLENLLAGTETARGLEVVERLAGECAQQAPPP